MRGSCLRSGPDPTDPDCVGDPQRGYSEVEGLLGASEVMRDWNLGRGGETAVVMRAKRMFTGKRATEVQSH